MKIPLKTCRPQSSLTGIYWVAVTPSARDQLHIRQQ